MKRELFKTVKFKTENEFISEFGPEWKNEICWNNSGSMDYLLGQEKTIQIINGKYYLLNESDSPIDYWVINSRMFHKVKS